MASVAKRQQEAQAGPPKVRHRESVRVETNAERFQWLEEVNRRGSALGFGAVALALYLFLSWNRKDGFCFPGQEIIAAALGASLKSIGRYQKILERNGLLIVEKSKMRRAKHPHNVYFLALPHRQNVPTKPLEKKEKANCDRTIEALDETPSVSNEGGFGVARPPIDAKSEVTGHQCPSTTGHQSPTNHVREHTGGPPAPPSESLISETSVVAREANSVSPSGARGAPDARPGETFSLGLEAHQLRFYEKLPDADRAQYREVSPSHRDEWQNAWEYQHDTEDGEDD